MQETKFLCNVGWPNDGRSGRAGAITCALSGAVTHRCERAAARRRSPAAAIFRSRQRVPNSEFLISNPSEAGYTLVIFVMVIAVMAIMMTVAVQTVSFQMQREREAELIFRGEQYVEGIRLFKQKYGRNPMRLKEMWEANPKVLRRKWKDPITDSERWGLVFVGQEGQEIGAPGGPGGRRPAPTASPTPLFEMDRDKGPGGDGGEGDRVGPIIGVYSLACEPSIKVYEGRTSYCEWRFVLKEEEGAGRGRGRGDGGGRPGGGSGGQRTDGTSPPIPRPTGTPRR
jgi:type II secretory pathway pseudopilin PulG